MKEACENNLKDNKKMKPIHNKIQSDKDISSKNCQKMKNAKEKYCKFRQGDLTKAEIKSIMMEN